MYVHKLSLKNFRNFGSLKVQLSEGINIFYGDNAQGKTNFLEAIYFCATGRSQRAGKDSELILFGEDEAHLKLMVSTENNDTISNIIYDKIDIHLKKNYSKGIAINGIPIKKLNQLFGILLCVIFSPEDLNLVKSGPSERRKFMDTELCQLSNIYYYELLQYHNVLKQRNNLLKKIKKNPSLKDTMFVWDEQLVNHGTKIIKYRINFIEKINFIANSIHSKITNNAENLKIEYKYNVSEKDFLHKLNKNLERDILLGNTSVGVHKDDLGFYINGTDVRIFGSQGQQRTASLSAKLAEIELIKEKKHKIPVLLLDDVLSELDEHRQKYLIKSIYGIQSIITCTGIEDIMSKISEKATVFKVENGNVFRK